MTTPDGSVETGNGTAPDTPHAVSVPLNQRALTTTSPQRIRRIREHLVHSLRDLRTMKDPVHNATPLRPEPAGFAGTVARAGCTLCGGYCCKGGGEHAYLDERDLARVRQARPDLAASAVIRLYMERVPAEGYAGSCVFHGAQGCTLDRSLRSDVCNSYFCNALRDAVATAHAASSIALSAAGANGETRKAPLLRNAAGGGAE